MADRAAVCSRADSPFLSEFAAMDMDERWVSRSPEAMLETFHWFRGEGFGLIVDDLLRLPARAGRDRRASGCCRTWYGPLKT